MEEKVKVNIYTDGACSGNPGPGGYGAVLVHVDSNGVKHEKEFSAGYKHVTNNQMELLAVIVAVEAFSKNWIDGWIKRGWKTADKKPVKNVELWQRLLKALKPHDIDFVWVKGHAGHPYNERCDQLAVTAYKQDNLKEDLL